MLDKAIGVFDSGVGGLTVAREIIDTLPHENIIYLGDTARVPYGSRSKNKIISFSLELVSFLLRKNIKILVVACNTISATAIDQIRSHCNIPVIEVIGPTVKLATITTQNKKIGVIGTEATIQSDIYKKSILALLPEATVFSRACPLLVPLIEEGLVNHTSTKTILKEYLNTFKDTDIDTFILGCTHYPLIKNLIRLTIPHHIKILDSAYPTALTVKKVLREQDLLNSNTSSGSHEYFVTDNPKRAKRIAEIFYGRKIHEEFEKINLS